MKRRAILKAIVTLPMTTLAARTGTASANTPTSWTQLTSARLDPASDSLDILAPHRAWNIQALRLMPHGSGIWIDSVETVAADGAMTDHVLKRRLLPGRSSGIVSFHKPVRSMRVRYAALPFGGEELILAVHVKPD